MVRPIVVVVLVGALVAACGNQAWLIGDGTSDAGVPEPDAAACGDGETRCDGVCVALASSPLHCGDCGVACGAGLSCDLGACVGACADGRVSCAGACLDVTSDAKGCGACGAACGEGQRCKDAACECLPSRTACGAACAALVNDPLNCGSCGVQCEPGAACRGGRCD